MIALAMARRWRAEAAAVIPIASAMAQIPTDRVPLGPFMRAISALTEIAATARITRKVFQRE